MKTPTRAGALLAAGTAALTMAACSASPVTVHGNLDVDDFSNSGSGCLFGSDSGYSDISQGAQVTVTAPDGTVLGAGQLGAPVSKVGSTVCLFRFTVSDVKGGEPRYGVTISHRGTVWFTPKQISTAGLQLGS